MSELSKCKPTTHCTLHTHSIHSSQLLLHLILSDDLLIKLEIEWCVQCVNMVFECISKVIPRCISSSSNQCIGPVHKNAYCFLFAPNRLTQNAQRSPILTHSHSLGALFVCISICGMRDVSICVSESCVLRCIVWPRIIIAY